MASIKAVVLRKSGLHIQYCTVLKYMKMHFIKKHFIYTVGGVTHCDINFTKICILK